MADPKLIEFMKDFLVTDVQLVEVYKRFCAHIRMGLNKDQNVNADTKCFITYVHRLPTGNETGKALGADLGGTNFRILMATLNGADDMEIEQQNFPLSDAVMTGTADQLFDFLAECFSKFLADLDSGEKTLPLGFTFSFPCVQIDLAQATLVKWTKGYSVPGVVGEDVGQMLKDAIKRRLGLNVDLVAVLNDTTGTLMSAAQRNPECRIGLIVGTGCNACYMENVKCVDMLDENIKTRHKNVIINIEWGAFGERGALEFIRTKYDRVVDENSPNVSQQLGEKMIAGMYLGELLRLVMIDAISENLLFNSVVEKQNLIDLLQKSKDIFESEIVTSIDGDDKEGCETAVNAMKELLKIQEVAEDDVRNIKFICEALCKRSATMIAVQLSALCNKINEPKVVVAVDGAVYRNHPKYDGYMRTKMRRFVNPKIEFDIITAEDGSGRGAAILAAAHVHAEGEEGGYNIFGV